jgi:hypothetical protein
MATPATPAALQPGSMESQALVQLLLLPELQHVVGPCIWLQQVSCAVY